MQHSSDAYHNLFQLHLTAHRPVAGAERSGALTALDILAAEGHDTVVVGDAPKPIDEQPAFDRLEQLAWRMIDREQGRFARAIGNDDREGAATAVDIATCFLDLLTELRAVQSEHRV